MSPTVERTPDGRRLCVSRSVPATRAAAWTLLTDTRRWSDWGPSVSAVESTDRFVTAGTTGRVQVLGGPWVPFEVTTCEDYRWTWDVARVPATGHRVIETPSGRTNVTFEIPLLAAGYAVVCERALDRIERLLAE